MFRRQQEQRVPHRRQQVHTTPSRRRKEQRASSRHSLVDDPLLDTIPTSTIVRIFRRTTRLYWLPRQRWSQVWETLPLTHPDRASATSARVFCDIAREILGWADTKKVSPQAKLFAAIDVSVAIVGALPEFNKELGSKPMVPEMYALEQRAYELFIRAFKTMSRRDQHQACVAVLHIGPTNGPMAVGAEVWLDKDRQLGMRRLGTLDN